MARDKKLLIERNKRINKRFATLCKLYPHWKVEFIIEKVADEFCLAARTLENILKDR